MADDGNSPGPGENGATSRQYVEWAGVAANLAAAIAGFSDWFVPISAQVMLAILVFAMVAAVMLQIGNVISRPALMAFLAVFLIGMVLTGIKMEGQNDSEGEVEIPFIQVEAFIDRPQGDTGSPNGTKDSFESYVDSDDRVSIEFTPERSRGVEQILDKVATFSGFEAGERVLVSVCGSEQSIQSYVAGKPGYRQRYELVVPIPEARMRGCSAR